MRYLAKLHGGTIEVDWRDDTINFIVPKGEELALAIDVEETIEGGICAALFNN
jgi:hypothetical protein